MTVEDLLETIPQVGGKIWAEGDKLRFNLPGDAADWLIPVMRELKPQLLQLLTVIWRDAEQGRLEFERLFNLPDERKNR